MKFFLPAVFLLVVLHSAFAQNSENGYWCPTKGTIRVLLVYAEVVNDPDYKNINSGNWQAGEIPERPDIYFSERVKDNDGLMTRYFHEASFGTYNIIGDYFPQLIQVDYSKAGYQGVKQVVAALNAYKKKKLKTANGRVIRVGNFDSWQFTGPGLPKINKPDSMLDLLIILWRVNSKLSAGTNSGYCSNGAMEIPFRNYRGLNCFSEFVSHDNDAFGIMRHEFSHTLYGGNNFHTAGPGAGRSTFINAVGGFSNLSSWDHSNHGWNGWDRWRMGWKNPLKQYLISGYSKAGSAFIEKDFERYAYNGDSELVYLRDFRKTGDAVRIQLPCIDSPSLRQYLWLEFHSDTSLLETTDRRQLGMFAYIEVGKDNKKSMYPNGNTSPGDYLYFLPASGRFDFQYGRDTVKKKIYVKKINSLSDPLNGNHSLMRPLVDLNHNYKLDADEMVLPEMIITEPHDTVVEYTIFGNPRDVFKPSYKTLINIGSNPSSANVATYNYPHSKSAYDEDTVFINGLRVEIVDSTIITVKDKKYPALGIKIKWNDYRLTNNVRWCGTIALKPVDRKVRLEVTNNSTLLFDRGLSVTQQNINKTDTVNGEFYFSSPTTFVCYPNTELHIYKGSTLKLTNKSTLVMKKGSELIIEEGANVEVDASSKIIKE